MAPLLSPSVLEEEFYLYLVVTPYVVSSALIREDGRVQKPIYYTSRALRGVKGRCPLIEKLAFALIMTSRKLRHYFQAQALADFIVEFTPSDEDLSKVENRKKWIVHVDGLATQHAGGIGVVLLSQRKIH